MINEFDEGIEDRNISNSLKQTFDVMKEYGFSKGLNYDLKRTIYDFEGPLEIVLFGFMLCSVPVGIMYGGFKYLKDKVKHLGDFL